MTFTIFKSIFKILFEFEKLHSLTTISTSVYFFWNTISTNKVLIFFTLINLNKFVSQLSKHNLWGISLYFSHWSVQIILELKHFNIFGHFNHSQMFLSMMNFLLRKINWNNFFCPYTKMYFDLWNFKIIIKSSNIILMFFMLIKSIDNIF